MGAGPSQNASIGDVLCLMCMSGMIDECARQNEVNNEQHRARVQTLADRFALRHSQVEKVLELSGGNFPVRDTEKLYKAALDDGLSDGEWQAEFNGVIRRYRRALKQRG